MTSLRYRDTVDKAFSHILPFHCPPRNRKIARLNRSESTALKLWRAAALGLSPSLCEVQLKLFRRCNT
jgi:hypothetical protein